MKGYRWQSGVTRLAALVNEEPGGSLTTYGGRPRTGWDFGVEAETATIRAVAEALFGWLP